MKRLLCVISIAAAFVLASSTPATATTIEYQATNLGGDLWEYEYSLSGVTFQADQGFAVFFDQRYSALEVVAPVVVPPALPDWDPIVRDFDTALMLNGYYDALALVDNAPLGGPFQVKFRWFPLAGEIPASQPFEIYRLNAQDTPVPFEFGQTIALGAAAVPEPSTLLLLTTGVAVARGLRKRKS